MDLTLQEWQAAVRQAPSEGAVLEQVRRYLASITAEELACLPESSRPPRLGDREDLMAYNLQLSRDEILGKGSEAARSLHRAMVIVVNEATSRIAAMPPDVRPGG